MSLRARITIQLLTMLAAVTLMTVAVLAMLNVASAALEDVEIAHRQYRRIVNLAEHANAYSEQIAETLLIGPSEREDYLRARERVNQAMARLRVQLDLDIAALPPGEERDREQADLERLRGMRVIYRRLEFTAERAFALDEEGRRKEALDLFQSQIEDGLDLRLQELVETAQDEETKELEAADARFDVLRDRLLIAALVLAGLMLAVTATAGLALFRAVMRPVRALIEGAGALGAGKLEHRIPVLGKDELGVLAGRFNTMAEELARERDGLLAARHGLEVDVAERTRELKAANDRLTLLDQQRVAFLADVSHELRTPLTALRTEAEVALRGPACGAECRDSLERIVDQTADMGRQIEDLLFIARSEAGQVRFDTRRMRMDELVEPMVRAVANIAEARGVELSAGAAAPAWVLGDPRRLRQALLVLLDNAVRYSLPGGRVEVSAEVADGEAAVRVRDWGTGLDAEEAPHVFDRFFRGQKSVEINPGGSGLGLPIARWIAQKHGGDVSLAAREDGTDALLSLPLAPERRAA